MKVLYLFRDSYEAKYILAKLDRKKLVDGIIIETGKKARKDKIKRLFSSRNILNLSKAFLDVIAILFYSQIMNAKIAKSLGSYTYPKQKVKLIISDANDKACLNLISNYTPDVIFIYGTAILRKEFLSKTKAMIINIHSGIVPMYRNVHSDFWAYLNKDYQNIGISLMRLNKGIDSGKVVLQKKISLNASHNLIDIKIKNLQLIPRLIEKVIIQIKSKKLVLRKQDKNKIGFYKTPGFLDLIKLFV